MRSDAVNKDPVLDWPVYWFTLLEQAVNEGDHLTAAEAYRELLRLGVRVAYGRQANQPKELSCAE